MAGWQTRGGRRRRAAAGPVPLPPGASPPPPRRRRRRRRDGRSPAGPPCRGGPAAPSGRPTAPTPGAARVGGRHEGGAAAGRLPTVHGVGGRRDRTPDARRRGRHRRRRRRDSRRRRDRDRYGGGGAKRGGVAARRAVAQGLACGRGRRAVTDAAAGAADTVVTHRAGLVDVRGNAKL
ncbi:hypothetical protein BU14_0120s0009 [Porphyra umbilicalis]|uniref:Uncharacterized protein n=1 Tax=Porphyra umbilicalis TaxID=2786 RepID=A0A1X6PBL3_PORUM|nr:hypothetical protein BU14_0120s0009 [Porphyra umbilicalis]|eukprot:OSX78126.1 hypothetical protein BU14_0120s0009 [Porphyra umbilicalis]